MSAPVRSWLGCLVLALCGVIASSPVRAQPPALSPDQLDQLVGPIALYPDAILSQVLTASAYPDEVGEANDWAQSHKDMNGEELGLAMSEAAFAWDASVQALVPFPTVLETMTKDKAWLKRLGDAVLSQRGDV